MFLELEEKFYQKFGKNEELIYVRSPGRVNLIGEHTDYNSGFVFPVAINLEILGVARKRNDSLMRIYSLDFLELKEFSLQEELSKEGDWSDYIKAIVSELKRKYNLTNGIDVVYKSNLPVGSGLSSSAAFELVNVKLLSYINNILISKKDSALLCQNAENNFIGVNCGIMDQFAIALGQKDSALFLDTQTLDYQIVPLYLKDYNIIIGNTNKPRKLSESSYNQRREECQQAVNNLRKNNVSINSLRDVNIELLEKYKNTMDKIIYNRAKHIVEENNRVMKSVAFLQQRNIKDFGELMTTSHYSLKNLYEVSCFELDVLVEEALKIDGVLGSRMTGAGFGGCTVSIVKENSTKQFIEKVGKNYEEQTGLKPEFYITSAVNGVEIIENFNNQ